TPRHPSTVYFEDGSPACFMYDDADELAEEVRLKWNERGDVEGFLVDLEQVTDFLQDGFKNASIPSLEQAASELGRDLVGLWITGSARNLLDHYFTSDRMKMFFAMDVIESGPVAIDSPYSAFNIPIMATGTVFGGKWGFVKGGLWKVPEAL